MRVVVLEGAGAAFSAGADLPAFMKEMHARPYEVADLGRRAADALADLPQITVAGIRGHCVGGAVVLAAACDIRVAAEDARISLPEVDAGIPLAWGGIARLVRLVGESLATDLVLTCRSIDAQEAHAAGYVSRVQPVDGWPQALHALTHSIAERPAYTLWTTKQQLLRLRLGTFEPRADADALNGALSDPDVQRHMQRYIEAKISGPE